MPIATTRWILFCQLCRWVKSRPQYGPVRYQGGYRETCGTSRYPYVESLANSFVGGSALRGGYTYQRGIGTAAVWPYPEIR